MPGPETAGLNDRAILWEVKVVDGLPVCDAYGRQKVEDCPRVIRCDWNDKLAERLSRDGTTTVLDAIVRVAEDIEIGSLMMLARIDELPQSLDLSKLSGRLMYVKTFEKVYAIKGRACKRTVGLIRYSDSLPAQ
jgi:hypothetical protein